jgi:hypothetical protein
MNDERRSHMSIKDKLVEVLSVRLFIYLLLGTGSGGVAFAWGADIWASVARSRENSVQIASMSIAMVAHNIEEEKQMQQIQEDLRWLKMLTGIAQVRATGDEMTAAVNTKSVALRFRPGQEVWVTNYTDPGDVRVKVKIEERSFRADADILIRLSKRAGEALEVTEDEIDVGLEPVVAKK